MAAIDIHTHAFPDKIAERALAKLAAKGEWDPVGDGTVDGLLESMDNADIDLSVVCSIATKPEQVKGIISWCRDINSPRIIPFASVHPKDHHIDKWVARIAKRKLGGIKLHPMYQDFVVDDENAFAIYRSAIEHGLPVAMHTGWDIGFENDPIPDRASPERIARVLDQLPELRLLCTHLGGWRLWNEAQHFLAGRDVWWETSFCLPYMTEADFVDQIKAHRPDRVCFGTDWPWHEQDRDIQRVGRLGFDPKFLDALLFRNAAAFLGM